MRVDVRTVVAVVALALLALVACGGSPVEAKDTNPNPDYAHFKMVQVDGGRTIPCVFYNNQGTVGGVTCDWGAR